MSTMVQPKAQPATRASALLQHFNTVRAATESLAAPLSAEDQLVQSAPEASPVKWHRAHVTWFFETFILAEYLAGYRAFNPAFRDLFNSYYNALGPQPDRNKRGCLSRPSAAEIAGYRAHVDDHIRKLFSQASPTPAVFDLLELGIHHEQQHQELIVTDLKHALWSNPLRPAYRTFPKRASAAPPPMHWIPFDQGVFEIGHVGDGFSFDNELPQHKAFLPAFSLASRLVTNGEYLGFIASGGYQRPEFWLSDGWEQVRSADWRSPLYWERDGDSWKVFTLSGVQPLDLDEPVCHVSYYEAEAYARWAQARLPKEEEWEHAAADAAVEGNLLEAGQFHPSSAAKPNAAAHKISQLFGDVWEWTASAYLAYPGFQPAEGALGEYNGKFMCNQFVLRGGSCATPQSHIRATYRNFFPPAARWQFSGIRLAR